MRQFRDKNTRQLKNLTSTQFMEVWSHYDHDGRFEYKFALFIIACANFINFDRDFDSIFAFALCSVFFGSTLNGWQINCYRAFSCPRIYQSR